jgi:2-deoxy-D-gluconate 3-dehydrogenase
VGGQGDQRQRHRARLLLHQQHQALRADEDRSRDILARIPAGRWGTPADIGGAAVFLASSAADYVHGTLLAVDGGWLAR